MKQSHNLNLLNQPYMQGWLANAVLIIFSALICLSFQILISQIKGYYNKQSMKVSTTEETLAIQEMISVTKSQADFQYATINQKTPFVKIPIGVHLYERNSLFADHFS